MAKSLKDGEVEELKQNTDIVSIISNYVNLKKSGKNFIGLCPFHKEKTPSFVVDPQTQLYHCFGCGNGGDVISFIMKTENLSFIEAVELLAKRTGYTLQYVETGNYEKEEKKSRLIELNELARKYYNYILFETKTGKRALEYLKSRKISGESLKKFEIGYSPDTWDSFIKFAHSRNFTDYELVESGLCTVSGKEGNQPEKKLDRFRGRIIFPIRDLLGRTIGFGGRIIPEDFQAQKDIKNMNYGSFNTFERLNKANQKRSLEIKKAKYINSPETKIYSKSKNLYGIFEAKNSIVENDEVLVVEGYMDVITLYENKIFNVVASLGTALTSEQIKLLSRFTKNIVLVFDSDKAGVSASVKGMERLKEYNVNLDLYNENNLSIKVCLLEKDYDPADYVTQKDPQSFLEKVKGSIDIIDFSIDNIIGKYNIKNLTEKLRAANELLQFIGSLSSRIIQEECIKKIAFKLNLKESILLEEMLKKYVGKNTSQNIKYEQMESEKEENPYEEFEFGNLSPQKKKEIEALQFIIHGYDCKQIILNLNPELFRFEDTRKLFMIAQDKIKSARKNNEELNFPLIISSEKLKDEKLRKIYNYIYFSDSKFLNSERVCLEIEYNLEKLFLNEKIELLKNKIFYTEQKIKEIKISNLEENVKDEKIKLLETDYRNFCALHIEFETKKKSLEISFMSK